MGGAAGHIDHLYEDGMLEVREIEKIFSDKIFGTEKIDGINIMFQMRHDGVFFARKKSDIGAGGVTLDQLIERYAETETVRHAYGECHSLISEASKIKEIASKQGESLENKWLSADIVSSKKRNLIAYPQNVIVIHNLPESLVSRFYWERHFNKFNSAIEFSSNMRHSVSLDEVHKNLLRGAISSFEATFDVSLFAYLTKKIQQDLEFNTRICDRLAGHLSGCKTATLHEIKKNLTKNEARRWEQYNKTVVDHLINERKFQLNRIVTLFGAAALKEDYSTLFHSTSEVEHETTRLRDVAIRAAVTVASMGDDAARAYVKQQLQLLEGCKIVPIEGIVFEHNCAKYKLTGTFSPVNRIVSACKNRIGIDQDSLMR